MDCHQTCLTCSSAEFNACLTCPNSMTLVQGSCYCDSIWQNQCTAESHFRQVLMFLDMFMAILLVAIMIGYLLKIRLSISFRIWSGLNGLSLLIYSEALYLEYQDYFGLKSLAYSNGPYFLSYRVMQSSFSHVMPTIVTIGIIVVLLFALYLPFSAFEGEYQSYVDYLKQNLFHFFDTLYFLCSRMMFFFIGKVMSQLITSEKTVDPLSITFLAFYSLICLLAIVRTMVLYHRGTTISHLYSSPIYLYTMLSPITFIGFSFITISPFYCLVYGSPLALLLLIILLNRNMKVFTKANVPFYVLQVLMSGVAIAYILVDGTVKTYLLTIFQITCFMIVLIECVLVYKSGVDLSKIKVHPEDVRDYEKQEKKQIMGRESNYSNQWKRKNHYI